MTRALLAQMTTTARFRLPLPREQAEEILTACYRAEVMGRRREYDPTFTAAAIRHIAASLTAESPRLGIMLCGLYGLGKTTMLRAIGAAIRTLSREIPGNPRLLIVGAREITARFRDAKTMASIRNERLLAIDDLGTEPKELLDYGNATMPVCDIIEHRYAQQLYTLLSTNLNPREVTARYGERVGDRLNEMMDIVPFGGTSYRKAQKAATDAASGHGL